MKKKCGIIAIGIVLLFVGLAVNPATANNVSKKENEEILLEYLNISEEGKLVKEKIALSEEDFQEFKEMIDQIFEKIKEKANSLKLKALLNSFKLLVKYPKLRQLALKMIQLRPLRRMALVMSYGTNYKLNPLTKSEIKIRDRFSMWRYNSKGALSSKTYILRPLKTDFDVLTGMQVGFMYKFTGIYIYVARQIPKLSYTFFMGTARMANGFDLDFQTPEITDIPAPQI